MSAVRGAVSKLPEVDLNHPMPGDSEIQRHAFGRQKLLAMPLAIVERHRMQSGESLRLGDGQTGGAVESSTGQNNC